MSIENTSRHKAQASETNNNQIERSFAEFDPTYDPQNNTESVEQKSLFPGHITVSPTGYDKTPIGQAIEDGHITMVSSDQINDDPTVHFDGEHRYYENPTATPASATPEVTPAEKKKLSTGKKVGMGAAGIAALSVVIPVSDYVEKKFFEKSVELQFEAIAGQDIPSLDAPGIDLDNNTAVIEQDPIARLAAMGSSQFLNPMEVTRTQQVEYSKIQLDAMREESLAELREDGYELNPVFETNDADDSLSDSQGVLDKFTVDAYSAWKIGQTNPDEAIKVLAGIMNPENQDDWDRFVGTFTNGGAPLVFTGEVTDWSDNFYKDNFRDVESNGYAMRVMTANVQNGNSTIQQQITIRQDGGEWTIQKIVPYEDESFILDMYEFNLNITE
ncbi:hypothetical protein A2707_04375 [Candidatus Saccharibacteria bacterium RIFCSPHIGHO2_01_FULL_45_15]|nr:MAG: hypothetical protein A2707_04375 [Candidatus Saccharibacteria bacterium RIFCSPHIGHO2_01_FULL_45_15]OGL27175.1 MAG: hypothetical protein A3C39_01270 [Candidatus Saccharibacteria bacterium RIFCSPHIGHO2_02_FULL_46_12]OGL32784.1 MAG: hypothetical protein A3E76_05585 [Candidatus Saccharibacteria bacterium RIFCSPHIGHO2_12_FULL_44_22]